MECDQSPQIKGVVIISLPPPDNPCLGKTITAFTLGGNHYSQSHQTHIQEQEQSPTHQQYQFPVRSQPPQNPETQFSFSRFYLGTPRKVLGFVCISLFALVIYRSFFSSTIQELKASDDDQRPKSFIFPLYHKFGTREISQIDVQHKLVKYVYKESLAAPADEAIFSHKDNELSSSKTAALDSSSSIFPVRGNVYPDGLYFTYILVGSPPRPYYLDVDTASDLTWIQCDAPCASCAKGANALYKPRRDNIVPPKDLLCVELQRNQKPGYCEACQQCDYEIEYADHSSSMGVLARDQLNVMMANGSATNFNFIFGCAYDQQGLLLNTLAQTDGILGLSRAKISLPSQLASRGIINNVLGHCLTNDVGGGGYMFLGDDFVPRWGIAWVPMLHSISIDVVVCRSSAFILDVDLFLRINYIQLKEVSEEGLIQDTSDTTLPFCWRAKFPIRSVTDVKQFFKTLTLQFGSKWWIISTKFRIPPEGYLVISNKGNVCLGILDGSKVHDGSTIILGDISLRGQLVIYDNVNKKIGWAPSDCMKPTRFKSLPFFEG
ncbi:aspartyl protease APCB1 [Jatropha curcas]|uniref:aspartyl protease APCB1 n=1 Tax=Jatropha curcas TaxID=180498 RepID=UPI0018937F4B|nr:aspartyl protease APCB1 [Jatropha curcas]